MSERNNAPFKKKAGPDFFCFKSYIREMMMAQLMLTLSGFLFADTSSFSKVPSGINPKDEGKPCVETGANGEEKCKIPSANANEKEPKLELPKPNTQKKIRETPRKK